MSPSSFSLHHRSVLRIVLSALPFFVASESAPVKLAAAARFRRLPSGGECFVAVVVPCGLSTTTTTHSWRRSRFAMTNDGGANFGADRPSAERGGDRRCSSEDGVPVSDSSAEGRATTEKQKPMSRLAMAAADWADEEEDELMSYWDRFDTARSDGNSTRQKYRSPISASSREDAATTANDDVPVSSTEELLQRYYENRGIDKSAEMEHSNVISSAINYASVRAASAGDAIRKLEEVRPYMQAATELGGSGLLELAMAYHADGNETEAVRICEFLVQNNPQRNIRLRAKRWMDNPSSNQRRYGQNKGFWASFEDFWS